METNGFKENSVVDSSYQPPLADLQNIQPRLIRLSELLKQITEKLVDCTFAAMAYGYVDAALRLELINFDVMNAVVTAMDSVEKCNGMVTSREIECDALVKEAQKLAFDIFVDMPLGFGLGVNAPSPEQLQDYEAISHYRYLKSLTQSDNAHIGSGDFDDALAASQQHGRLGTEQESENQPMAQFTEGQRVRLTRDLPDTHTDVHPIHHYKGDEGVIARPYEGSELGFRADRYYGDITTFRIEVDGERQSILNFCEAVEEESND